jgi:predicted dehydrogenase
METIRVGLIGSGFMGKAHSMAWANQTVYFWPPPALPRKVRLADVTPELASVGARRFGWESWTADWRQVTRAPDIDVVDVVAPNEAHAEIAIDAARHGKHVLCEKPLARTADEARAMLEAVTQVGVKHMTSFNYRKAPALATAKQLIRDGQLGRVFHFRGVYLSDWAADPDVPLSWRFQRRRAGSGALGDIGAHIIDVARFLVGDIARVCGMTDTFVRERPLATDAFDRLGRTAARASSAGRGPVDVDDAASFLFRFTDGTPGVIEATRFAYGRKNHLAFEINAERGSLAFNWERPNELRFYSTRDGAMTQGFRTILAGPDQPNGEQLWPVAGLGIGYAESTLLVIRDLLQAIVADTPPEPSFHDGWRVNAVVDAVLTSAHLGRWVDVPAPEVSASIQGPAAHA